MFNIDTTSTPKQAPRLIQIRPYPFNTTLANDLVSPLDEELTALYPEFDNPLKPGTQIAFDDDPDYKPNPVPVLSAPSEGDDNEDKDDDADDLHLFVAFDITDADKSALNTASSTNQNSKAYIGTPVGCVALKRLPYFPNHRRKPDQPVYTPASPPPTVAEIKRMYVVPSHRGVSISIDPSSSPAMPMPTSSNPTRLAASLLTAAAVYARDTLGLEKLVLEVGFRQVAAIRVYERLGWVKIADFGDYVGFGVEEGGVSLCYGLTL